jgi:hypothetical protein
MTTLYDQDNPIPRYEIVEGVETVAGIGSASVWRVIEGSTYVGSFFDQATAQAFVAAQGVRSNALIPSCATCGSDNVAASMADKWKVEAPAPPST